MSNSNLDPEIHPFRHDKTSIWETFTTTAPATNETPISRHATQLSIFGVVLREAIN